MSDIRVAVFRPDDERVDRAKSLLESLGVRPVIDSLLQVEPTGAVPRGDADFVVLTSKTGADCVACAGWDPGEAVVCAIGEQTAASLQDHGYPVTIVPETYSSDGLVTVLEDRIEGARVEIARSDHGSSVLRDGINAAGAFHHETVLYRLTRPPDAGDSTELAARGELDGVLFTSSLTVEYFLEAAAERGVREAALVGLNTGVVGVIGDPTRETAEAAGVQVDIVPRVATFEALAQEVVTEIRDRHRDGPW